jgi:undecaprenyl-diphosphatase
VLKWVASLYHLECNLFRWINRYYDHKSLNSLFHFITHAGGARFTIGTTIIILLFSYYFSSYLGPILAIALMVSHIPVAILKRLYPRKRPYLVLEQTKVMACPLSDFSFPSGHTTAIFSIVIPIILHFPFLTLILLPLAVGVGISRIFLGLHYPSDVLCGATLGTIVSLMTVQFCCEKIGEMEEV